MILLSHATGSGHLESAFVRARLPVLRAQLDFGDACFKGSGPAGDVSVGIEWKKIDDLLACLTNGRLAGWQLPGLADTYDLYFLIIVGKMRASAHDGVLEVWRESAGRRPAWVQARVGGGNRSRGWMWADVMKYLLSLEIVGGVHVRHVVDERELVKMIAAMYSWFGKPWEDHASLNVFHRLADPIAAIHGGRHTLVRRVAKELPGIGWKRSGEVAAVFQTVDRMVNGSEKEWARVTDKNGRGLGAGTIRKIQKAMRPFGG